MSEKKKIKKRNGIELINFAIEALQEQEKSTEQEYSLNKLKKFKNICGELGNNLAIIAEKARKINVKKDINAIKAKLNKKTFEVLSNYDLKKKQKEEIRKIISEIPLEDITSKYLKNKIAEILLGTDIEKLIL